MKKALLGLVVVVVAGFLLSACTYEEAAQADKKEAGQVGQQQQVYVDNQPVPAFDWSLERHLMIELYKARNNAVTTYSYVRNLNGQVVFSCKSIGFPVAANMQLTNPEKIADSYSQGGFAILPQAEPNGLYTSPSSMGTFVFCINSDGTVSPSYFESDVETHTAPLAGDMTKTEGESSLKINTKQ